MSRRYFWVLAPVLLASAAAIASRPRPQTAGGRIVQLGCVVLPLLATLGLANPTRFRWALRIVAAALAAGSVASFGALSAPDAALVVLLVGLPALQYLLSGRRVTSVDADAGPEAPKPRDFEGSAG